MVFERFRKRGPDDRDAVDREAVDPDLRDREAVDPDLRDREAVDPDVRDREAVDREAVDPDLRDREAVDRDVADPDPVGRDQAALDRGRYALARDEFGGINWGSAFFGWLVAVGLSVLIVAILTGGGAAIGIAKDDAKTATLAGAIALLVVLMAAYYCGGYVAGRMSRFDGARQGFGVWLFGLIVTILLALLALVAGSEYNVLRDLHLPRIPVKGEDLTNRGLITLAAIIVGTLLAAVVGGKVGQRYHTKVDRVGRERADAVTTS